MLTLEVHLDLHGGPEGRLAETLRQVKGKAAQAKFPRVDGDRPVLGRRRERHPAVDQAAIGGKRLEKDGGLRARQRDAYTGNRLMGAVTHLAGYWCHGCTENQEHSDPRSPAVTK